MKATMNREEIEKKAREISKHKESLERFSEEWWKYTEEVVIPFTEKYGPLYQTYNA